MRTLLILLAAALAWGQVPPSPTPGPGGAEVVRLVDTALAYARQEASASGGSYRFKVVQPPHLPPLPPGGLAFEAARLSKQDPVGRFFVVVSVKQAGQRVASVRVDLEGSWVGQVLRARRDLARKTDLTMDLLEATSFEGVPPEGALGTLPPGQRLRGPLAEGRVLTRADLEPIPLVKSGDKVRLTATSEVLTISLDTVARSRGGLGDRVRLEAPGSRRIVTAVVTGPGEARLEN